MQTRSELVTSEKVAKPGAQYSQALTVPMRAQTRLLFIAGQGPIDKEGRLVGQGDPEGQVRQVFANLQALLEAAGGGWSHVVEMNIYLTDIAHRPAVSKVRAELLAEPYPTATMVEVRALVVPEWCVEISVTAALPG